MRFFRRLCLRLFLLFLLLALLSVVLVALLRVFDPPVWAWQLGRELSPPVAYPAKVQHRWVGIDRISPRMQLAVIASEDQRYPLHRGLDLEAIQDALDEREKRGRVRGASTITQQTAKNLFLWPDKSLFRKGLEAWFAIWLELLLDKQRILELYLNIVEFGPGIYGVEAASQRYFGKAAAALHDWEAARLAAVLPNPYRFSVARPSPYILQRGRWIRRQMRQLGQGYLKQLD
ncbi:monofunctional biosynthetic peptidoglycan transglycosylase [Marinobacterium jannaschii]|uniref:monofunctional biosynthetic peptidoglycan transglycosylase n=1 Tax=Marinobacterium jannaschii TaxID=64970 RepID=UPI000687E5F5|nr:monofunctional biosynthetic peptidoglycan transglycosylase [Marinobacterium jannaschii]